MFENEEKGRRGMFENEERGEGEGPSITKIRKNHLVFLNDWSHKNKPLESCAILAGKSKGQSV